MEHRFLVLPICSLEIVLTELPGAHDSLQIPFIGWLWPVARCTGSLFYLPNVAILIAYTSTQLWSSIYFLFLSLFLFILLLSVSFSVILFFICLAFILSSFLLFFCSLHVRNFTGDWTRYTALQNGYKYFGIINETEYPLTTQILTHHEHLKLISHLSHSSHSF
jgi:hypothetical protein